MISDGVEDEEKWLAAGIAGLQQNAFYMHRSLVFLFICCNCNCFCVYFVLKDCIDQGGIHGKAWNGLIQRWGFQLEP